MVAGSARNFWIAVKCATFPRCPRPAASRRALHGTADPVAIRCRGAGKNLQSQVMPKAVMTKALWEALRQLAAARSTWTLTMIDTYFQAAQRLEKLGLVEFRPRYVQRGKYRGEGNGHDVVVTRVGRALLREDREV